MSETGAKVYLSISHATELQRINHGNSWSVYFRDPVDRTRMRLDQQRSGKHNA
jgi:hypothetical protein